MPRIPEKSPEKRPVTPIPRLGTPIADARVALMNFLQPYHEVLDRLEAAVESEARLEAAAGQLQDHEANAKAAEADFVTWRTRADQMKATYDSQEQELAYRLEQRRQELGQQIADAENARTERMNEIARQTEAKQADYDRFVVRIDEMMGEKRKEYAALNESLQSLREMVAAWSTKVEALTHG